MRSLRKRTRRPRRRRRTPEPRSRRTRTSREARPPRNCRRRFFPSKPPPPPPLRASRSPSRMPTTINRLVMVSRDSAEPCSQSTLARMSSYRSLAKMAHGMVPNTNASRNLNPNSALGRHLHFGLAEVIQERQVREKGRAEEVALDELPLFHGHAEGVDRGCDDLGGTARATAASLLDDGR